jgi:DNA-directed RNA polymerase specialized sigma24 family protein
MDLKKACPSLTLWLDAQKTAPKTDETKREALCTLILPDKQQTKIQRADPKTVQIVEMFLDGKSLSEIAKTIKLPLKHVAERISLANSRARLARRLPT